MKTLVFLHGWGATGRIWRHQAEALPRQDTEILTPTLPAWEAAWLLDYLAQLPLAETVVVGWSLGGMLLMEALSRGATAPAGVILVATPVCFGERPDHPLGQRQAVVRALRRTVRQDPARGLADFAGRCLAPGEADFHAEILESFEPRENGADLVLGLDYLLNTDLRPRLNRVPPGALIIQGEADGVVHLGQAEILQQRLREARLVTLPGAGHAPFLTRPGEFNEIVEAFLREEARGQRTPAPFLELPPPTP